MSEISYNLWYIFGPQGAMLIRVETKNNPLLSLAASKLGLNVATGIFDIAYWKQSSSSYTSWGFGFLIWGTSNRAQDSSLYGDF